MFSKRLGIFVIALTLVLPCLSKRTTPSSEPSSSAGNSAVDLAGVDGHGNTSLTLACRRGNLAEVDRLIESGVDVNQPNVSGTPPIVEAIIGGHEKIVATLLSHEAEINTTIEGQPVSVLSLALSMNPGTNENQIKTIKMIIKAGVDVNDVFMGKKILDRLLTNLSSSESLLSTLKAPLRTRSGLSARQISEAEITVEKETRRIKTLKQIANVLMDAGARL